MALLHAAFERLAVADDTRFDHLAQQVVALAGALAHAGEDREAVVAFGDVVDELHDEHRLAHARTAEQTDFAALDIGFQEVDHLDARVEHLLRGGQFFELRRLAVDRSLARAVEPAHTVDALSRDVHQAPFDLIAHGHRNRAAERRNPHVPPQPVRGIHRHRANRMLADVLLHLDDEPRAVLAADRQRLVDGRKLPLRFGEANVHHRADDL